MLPALTVRARRVRRLHLVAAAALFALAAVASAFLSAPVPHERAPVPLADRLPAASWGFAVPSAWFAVPVAARTGDRIDVLAVRAGDRPTTTAIAFDIEVMSVDDRAVVLGVSAFDAAAIATARGGGQLLIPLLRSTR